MKKAIIASAALSASSAQATVPPHFGPDRAAGRWEIHKNDKSKSCELILTKTYNPKLQAHIAKSDMSCKAMLGGTVVSWRGGTDSMYLGIKKPDQSRPAYIRFEADNLRDIDSSNFVGEDFTLFRS